MLKTNYSRLYYLTITILNINQFKYRIKCKYDQTIPLKHTIEQPHYQEEETQNIGNHIVLFVCFVALRPKSTDMVIAGWSVHLTTLFPGQA